jgi:hypothetical protein
MATYDEMIKSIESSNWQGKDKIIKSLKAQREEGKVQKSDDKEIRELALGSVELEYGTARNLISSSSAPADVIDKQLDTIEEIYGPLLEKSEVEKSARKEAIQKAINSEPLVRFIQTTGQLYQNGALSDKEAYLVISKAIEDSAHKF